MMDRLQADDGQRQMFHPCRHEDDRALSQSVQFPADTDFDHAAQIVRIIRVGADESDQLIKVVAVLIMLIKRTHIRCVYIPGHIHLECTRYGVAVDPKKTPSPLFVDLLKLRTELRCPKSLYDIFTKFPLVIHDIVFFFHKIFPFSLLI